MPDASEITVVDEPVELSDAAIESLAALLLDFVDAETKNPQQHGTAAGAGPTLKEDTPSLIRPMRNANSGGMVA